MYSNVIYNLNSLPPLFQYHLNLWNLQLHVYLFSLIFVNVIFANSRTSKSWLYGASDSRTSPMQQRTVFIPALILSQTTKPLSRRGTGPVPDSGWNNSWCCALDSYPKSKLRSEIALTSPSLLYSMCTQDSSARARLCVYRDVVGMLALLPKVCL